MATVKTEDGRSQEIEDGNQIIHACEELGVPFGCQSGICGTCKIEIIEGAENLNELNEAETEIGDRDKNNRLACQAKVNTGNVRIKY